MNNEKDADRPLRILHLEDSPRDAEIIRERLIDAGFSMEMDWASNEQEFISYLQNGGYDLILADYLLPGFDAPAALLLTKSLSPGVPFIAVTGAVGEEKAVELLRQGATDYVLKDRLDRLPMAIERALDEAGEHKALRLAEEALIRLNEELEQRVRERTRELERRNHELEQMNKAFVGRELRMVELKKTIAELEKKVQDKSGVN